MSRYLSPQSQGESLSTMERAPSPDSGNSGSSHDAKVPVPTARSAKRKASDLSDGDHQVDAHQAKQQSKLAPVAMAEGNVPLKKTWDLTALKERRGLLSKFRALVRLAVDQKLERLVNWEDQSSKSKANARKMVQGILKERPYELDLSDYFQDVDSFLAIAFQIAIHNRRKCAKAVGEPLPASKRRGKAKQSLLHRGDGAPGASTAETLEKKRGELEERRKRRRDNPTDESEGDIDEIDRMIERRDQSNRECLNHFKIKFLLQPEPEEHSDRVDHWVQEVDTTAAKPPIDSHLLYQDASTQTDRTAAYTDSGVQTNPILTSDLITKETLPVQKPLDAEGNQKRQKNSGSGAQAFKRPVRKSPSPVRARPPRREAGEKAKIRMRALQPQHVAHQANSTRRRPTSDRVRRK